MNTAPPVSGLTNLTEKSQVLKRVNSIAQEGDGKDTSTGRTVLGPVHQWDNDNPQYWHDSGGHPLPKQGYVPDGATVSNFQWLDFQAFGQEVTTQNAFSHGCFPNLPYIINYFAFSGTGLWPTENWEYMTVTSDLGGT